MRSAAPPAALVASILALCLAGLVQAQGPAGGGEHAELRAAELAFAASVAERDRERFASFLDPEAVFVSGSILRGAEAILEAWAPFFAESGPRLVWQPELVEVRSDGLGMTRGPYTVMTTAADGSEVSSSGVFTSIWRRDPDGEWKILFDTGCPDCAGAADPEG